MFCQISNLVILFKGTSHFMLSLHIYQQTANSDQYLGKLLCITISNISKGKFYHKFTLINFMPLIKLFFMFISLHLRKKVMFYNFIFILLN